MKIIHHNGYKEDEERLTFRPTIYRNLLESAKNVLLAMRKIGVDCANPRNRVRVHLYAPSFQPDGALICPRPWLCNLAIGKCRPYIGL